MQPDTIPTATVYVLHHRDQRRGARWKVFGKYPTQFAALQAMDSTNEKHSEWRIEQTTENANTDEDRTDDAV